MPTILLQKHVHRAQKQRLPKEINKVSMHDVREKIYNMKEWRALRLSYMAEHPLDELSLLSERVEAAEDIHHILSPFSVCNNLSELLTLLLDIDNLISLTKDHHGAIHGHPERLTEAEREHLKSRISALREKYHYAF